MASEPNYQLHTLQQLYDARSHIDTKRFPERAARLEAEIAKRKGNAASGATPAETGKGAPPRFEFRPRPSDGRVKTTFRVTSASAEWQIPVGSRVPNVIAISALLFFVLVWGVIALDLVDSPSIDGRPTAYFWWTVASFGALAIPVCLWLAFGREVITIRDGNLTIRRCVFGLGPSKSYEIRYVKNLRVSPSPSFYDGSNAYSRRPRTDASFLGFGYGVVAFEYDAPRANPRNEFVETIERFLQYLFGTSRASVGDRPSFSVLEQREVSGHRLPGVSGVTIWFGQYVDEPEANQIVEKITKKYPSLGKRSHSPPDFASARHG